MNGLNDAIHIRVDHGREYGQRQNVLIGSFSDRALTLFGIKLLLIKGMQMQGDVMDVDTNSLFPKRSEELSAVLKTSLTF